MRGALAAQFFFVVVLLDWFVCVVLGGARWGWSHGVAHRMGPNTQFRLELQSLAVLPQTQKMRPVGITLKITA